MAQIITIQDREGDTCYPITSTKAVIGENGVDLGTMLAQQKQNSENALKDYAKNTEVAQGLAGKQDVLSTTTDLHITADNIIGLTKKAKKAWLIDLFNADPNGRYNPDTDLFELNKLTLTWEEAYNVALWGNKLFDLAFTGSVDNNFRLAPIRTNLTPINSYTGLSLKWSKAFYFQREIEVIRLAAEDDQWNAFSTSDSWPVNAFNSCRKLREIIGKIDWSNATNVNANNFAGCYELREIRFYKLKHNISFVDCALLSLASFRYMIDNAINTAAITIIVHPDVFAKLTDETNTEWHAVYTAAAEKNISFIIP